VKRDAPGCLFLVIGWTFTLLGLILGALCILIACVSSVPWERVLAALLGVASILQAGVIAREALR